MTAIQRPAGPSNAFPNVETLSLLQKGIKFIMNYNEKKYFMLHKYLLSH